MACCKVRLLSLWFAGGTDASTAIVSKAACQNWCEHHVFPYNLINDDPVQYDNRAGCGGFHWDPLAQTCEFCPSTQVDENTCFNHPERSAIELRQFKCYANMCLSCKDLPVTLRHNRTVAFSKSCQRYEPFSTDEVSTHGLENAHFIVAHPTERFVGMRLIGPGSAEVERLPLRPGPGFKALNNVRFYHCSDAQSHAAVEIVDDGHYVVEGHVNRRHARCLAVAFTTVSELFLNEGSKFKNFDGGDTGGYCTAAFGNVAGHAKIECSNSNQFVVSQQMLNGNLLETTSAPSSACHTVNITTLMDDFGVSYERQFFNGPNEEKPVLGALQFMAPLALLATFFTIMVHEGQWGPFLKTLLKERQKTE